MVIVFIVLDLTNSPARYLDPFYGEICVDGSPVDVDDLSHAVPPGRRMT